MSNRVHNNYVKIYGQPPELREPYSDRKYSGAANEYTEMLTNSVSSSNKANVSMVSRPGALNPVVGGYFSPTGLGPVASGRGVTPNLP